MMRLFLVTLGLLLLSWQVRSETPGDSLLAVLKAEIPKKRSYDILRDQQIADLKKQLLASDNKDYAARYTATNKLYDAYKGYIFDSAYGITLQLLALGKMMQAPNKTYESQLKAGEIELESGRIKETFDCLSQFDTNNTAEDVRLRYYELKTRAYSDLDNYNTPEFHTDSNRIECIRALQSALHLSPPGSYERDKHAAELLNLSGQQKKAAQLYEELLNSNGLSDHQRAMVAYDLSQLTIEPRNVELLMLSAIYDIRSAENRTLASFELGKVLFKRGDLENAKIVLQHAYDQATSYGASLRKIEIEANLNWVSAQMLINSEIRKNRVLIMLLIILVVAIGVTALIAINVYHRLQKVKERELIVQQRNAQLDKINKKLLEDAGIKEEYIGYFFNAISGYIQKLEQIKRNTEHNYKLKNYDEVLKLARAIDIKHERHELFFTFDTIFLKLFPNFITAFNSLLKPEDQIWPKHNEALNTSLRIFALMRLGIRDNQTIANILESSLSTVYTYKNRIKSKALIQGEEFDNKIMEIQFEEV